MTTTPDPNQQGDGRSTKAEHEPTQHVSDFYAEPTYAGYKQSELLARYPQLRDMPLKTRIRKMVQYAYIDREWELFMQDFERRHGSRPDVSAIHPAGASAKVHAIQQDASPGA